MAKIMKTYGDLNFAITQLEAERKIYIERYRSDNKAIRDAAIKRWDQFAAQNIEDVDINEQRLRKLIDRFYCVDRDNGIMVFKLKDGDKPCSDPAKLVATIDGWR